MPMNSPGAMSSDTSRSTGVPGRYEKLSDSTVTAPAVTRPSAAGRSASASSSSVFTRAAAIIACCSCENCMVIWISGSVTRPT
jgi:hypothetical protein